MTSYATEKDAKTIVQGALVLATGDKPAALVKAVTAALAVRDPDAPVITARNGNPAPDPDLRDNENVPLPPVPESRSKRTQAQDSKPSNTARPSIPTSKTEVHPYVPDAWHDPTKTKIGYDIPLTRHFYTYTPPRPLDEIDAEIRTLEAEIRDLLAQVAE